jgi:hypothetical protein
MDDGLPNTPMLTGLASVNNFDPILPARYQTWMDALSKMSPRQRAEWLDAMDVGLAAMTSDAQGLPVFETRRPARPAWFVNDVQPIGSPEAALAAVSKPGFSPLKQAVIERSPPEMPAGGSGSGTAALIETDDPNQLHLRTSSDTGGWLVVSNMDYPGWGASVDGQPAQLYPADYVLSALWVPPGEHTIALVYRCVPFVAGLLLALIGLAILAAWLVKGRRTA